MDKVMNGKHEKIKRNGWYYKCTNRKRIRAEVIKTKEKRET